ncbi:MAG: tetratricopeptide repeat protein [Alphaproteobacteria bacterium]|nr:tetratricopeptide repeat protein [Alphaproteobacteria bacterium]
MINFIIKHWRAFGLGLVVLALAGFLAWQNHKIASLTRERDQARTSLVTYQAVLDGLQADTTAKITALEAEGGRQVARVKNLERLLGQIEGVSNEKDGIVAPVLRDAIDGLYGTDPASKADKARSAAKPSDLRGRPSTAKP